MKGNKSMKKVNLPEEIKMDGVVYVPKKSIKQKAEQLDGMEYVIVRTYSAGVFAGYLEKKDGKEVILRNARRLWYWSGASSLSQLAMEGVKNPDDCKFPCEVNKIKLTEAIEIIETTEEAKKSIANVKIWEEQ